jgi:hypothetical protein
VRPTPIVEPTRVELGVDIRAKLLVSSLNSKRLVRIAVDPKVDGREHAIDFSAFESTVFIAVCREEDNLFAENIDERVPQMSQILEIAAKVSVFVLQLNHNNGTAIRVEVWPQSRQ